MSLKACVGSGMTLAIARRAAFVASSRYQGYMKGPPPCRLESEKGNRGVPRHCGTSCS